MTHSEAAAPRKPRRLGFYAPFVALALVVAGWSGAWLWLMARPSRRLDAARRPARGRLAGRLGATGHVGGYPFRLDVDFTDLAPGRALRLGAGGAQR